MVDAFEVWSAGHYCGGAIRLVGTDWHHPSYIDRLAIQRHAFTGKGRMAGCPKSSAAS